MAAGDLPNMTPISADDFVQSVADALQFISYYHPVDYLEHLGRAYEREQSPAARDAIAQILTNSRMCAEGKRPICQDTGIVNAFVKVGMDVRFETDRSLAELVDEGVRRAYADPDNTLRASVVDDPLFARRNTRDNTPAVTHVELVPGSTVEVTLAAKGGGSENKSKFVMLNPSDSIVDWVLKTVPTMGAGWCPPGMLGLGVGGTAEKAMLLAKEALMDPLDMHELLERGPQNPLEELRIELYEKVNALGIGAQGLGGLTTVLDIKIRTYPTHAASKPVALIPNCAATRHAHFVLDGSGPAQLEPPSLEHWPKVTVARQRVVASRRSRFADARAGRELAARRDAAAQRPHADGPRCRHTNASPIFTRAATAARGRRFPQPRDLLRRPGRSRARRGRRSRGADDGDAHGQVHRPHARAHGAARDGRQGRAWSGRDRVDTQARRRLPDGRRRRRVPGRQGHPRGACRRLRGPRDGAIYEFDVRDMPVTVAVDARGVSVHQTGPAQWSERIRSLGIPVRVA
jgi:fumarate hydratase class I